MGMEREILFRGKRIDSGEWITGNFSKESDGSSSIRPVGKIIRYPVIPETVGQYTGLLDKNDNKIFEGDIIKFMHGRLLDVRFNRETLQWELTDVGVPDWEVNHLHNTLPLSELEVETCYGEMTSEIVGNIHDNPELLKEEIPSEKYKEFYEKKKAITERLRKDNEDFQKITTDERR